VLPFNQAIFTSSGAWTAPAGVQYVQVQMIGAGGTGGDANGLGFGGYGGGGGGGGGYVQSVIKVVPGTVYQVEVGQPFGGGFPSCMIEHGRKGGDTSFNGIIAGGGYGGAPAQVFPHVAGGGGSGGGVSAGPASYFGHDGQAGTLSAGGNGGPSGAPFAISYGTGGQGSNNCGAPSVLATGGYLRINW
jgi:hypothetical protein